MEKDLNVCLVLAMPFKQALRYIFNFGLGLLGRMNFYLKLLIKKLNISVRENSEYTVSVILCSTIPKCHHLGNIEMSQLNEI